MAKTVADEYAPAWVRELPSLTVTDAAWLAGVTEETLQRLITTGRLSQVGDRTGTTRVGMGDIFRAVFVQFGQKDSQIAMLRMQLASAIQREKELAELLHGKLLGDFAPFLAEKSEPPLPVPPHHASVMAVVKGKKTRKK